MFYIFDCNGNVIGNPKGYRTMHGAMRMHDQKRGKVYDAIWQAFYAAKALNPEHTRISSVKLIEKDNAK